MFSHKECEKKVRLFLKYHCSYTSTIQKLCYPSFGALRRWYKEYLISVRLHSEYQKKSNYAEEQKRIAVNHYYEYGNVILVLFVCLAIQTENSYGNGVKN